MRKLYFAPCNFVLFLEKMIFFTVFVIVEYYTILYYIVPYFNNIDNNNHFVGIIFSIYWAFISLTWFKSYIHVSWLDAGSVKNEIDRLSYNTDPECYIDNLERCQKCGVPKPFRSHHCSQCKMCYVRFDHHCPSVGNCIAYRNAQPFGLYLTYGTIMLYTMSFISIVPNYFNSPINPTLAKLVVIFIGICATCLALFAYNTMSGLINDQTTLERLYRLKTGHQKTNSEDLNALWGDNKLLWIFPHSPNMNGIIWARP